MCAITEKVDNVIVLIFAKFTPGAKDLREMVSYLKVTSALNRIRTYTNNYLKNMQSILMEEHQEISEFISDSLRINICTIHAFANTILEKDMVQAMSEAEGNPESYFNLLKYFRKNLKIIDRLETIGQRVIFARMGGKL